MAWLRVVPTGFPQGSGEGRAPYWTAHSLDEERAQVSMLVVPASGQTHDHPRKECFEWRWKSRWKF